MTMGMMTADGILPELQREIEEFMATHAAAVTASASDASTSSEIAKIACLAAPLSRLRSMATAIAKKRFCESIHFMLSWLATLEGSNGGSPESLSTKSSASWLVAYLIDEILTLVLDKQTQIDDSTIAMAMVIPVASAEKMVEQVLDRCVVVFQETFQSDAARAVESGGGFFAFKPVVSQLRAPTAENILQETVANAWRCVLARVSLCSLQPLRLRLQRQLLQGLLAAKSSSGSATTTKDYLLLKNTCEVRLGLDVSTFLWPTGFQQNVKDAALLLKLLQPLTVKPHKTQTRLAAVTAIGSMLSRELDTLSAASLQKVYASVHTVAEWNSCLSELHATALKLCSKREFTVAAWELRVGLLSVSPTEIFGRYWKEDVHALLRVQYQQNKDGGGAGPHAVVVLECVGRCFTHMLKRHFLTERRVPGELDCMEIINTTQAWCFFAYSKQRLFHKLKDHVVPVLVQISVCIASYNMLYAVQSHLRRLLLEAEHIFDEKRLVGLETLLALFELCGDQAKVDPSRPLDRKVLLANRVTLGELVGQTLIEANALFGGELLIESTTAQAAAGSTVGAITAHLAVSSANKFLRDEYRRSLAIHSYACALASLKHLYSALALSDDQKILILVRSCIHNERVIRDSASRALHHIIQHESCQASGIFRGVTDYMFRLSNHLTTPRDFDAFFVLIELLTSLLGSITLDYHRKFPESSPGLQVVMPWTSRKTKQESLLQIEAVAVYLLVFEDARLLQSTLAALAMVARARSVAFASSDSAAAAAATVERPSVIDVVRKAEWELRELLFGFEPASTTAALEIKDLGFLQQLIADLSSSLRASFRWSSALSVVFAHLAVWNPEVAAFMWADVNDKVTKLEPAMPSLLDSLMDFSSSSSSSFELARWRNLAILATTTACPHLLFQSSREPEDGDGSGQENVDSGKDFSLQSVISSSAVQALLRRLCRYLKSPSIDQKKAIILALGSTHISSLPILTEVLQKYEAEAFAPLDQPASAGGNNCSSRHASQSEIQPPHSPQLTQNGNGNGPRKFTKEQKARNVKIGAQLQLQWALGRCYCLLLQATQQRPLVLDDTTSEAVHRLQVVAMGVLDKTAATLRMLQMPTGAAAGVGLRDVPQHVVFMMQQDFCSSLRALAALVRTIKSPYSSVRRRHGGTQDRTSSISSRRSARRSSLSAHSLSFRQEDDNASPFEAKKRELWYHLLLGWCHSFSALANSRLVANLSGAFFAQRSPAREHWMQRCDVLGERIDETLLPWQWMDESDASRALGIEDAAMASFQRFFLCQTVFATLPLVVQGPLFLPMPITQDSAVIRWLDECFSVDTGHSGDQRDATLRGEEEPPTHHFQSLQWFSHRLLRGLLKSEFRAFVEICVDKSFFSVASGDKHNVAKHYFRAVCDVACELKQELSQAELTTTMGSPVDVANGKASRRAEPSSSQNLQVRVCHAILLHLGIEGDAAQRERAAYLINELYASNEDESFSFRLNATVSSGKRSSTAFGAQVMNRMQVAGATFLVARLAPLAFQVSMSILKFVPCCELVQQRKMLVVALPWLAEVSLVAKQRPRRDSSVFGAATGNHSMTTAAPVSLFDSDQLLSLLFRITTNLSASCHDQLEQAWLTLAFASTESSPENGPSNGEPMMAIETNLSRVLQFLFLQRTTSVRLSTAKMVVWWLCRWQSAAHEVLREALLLVETRRRQSADANTSGSGRTSGESHTGHALAEVATIQPVDDVFVFVIFMSDSCCHLATIPSYLYQNMAMREAMIVQTVHFAFLALFALALDPKSFSVHRFATSPSGAGGIGSLDDHQHQSLYVDASNDCLVLLRNLLGQLYAPTDLLKPIVDDLEVWSQSWRKADTTPKSPHSSSTRAMRQFERAMVSFASCLPPVLRDAWALECVKEITLALVPGSTLLSQTSSRCNNAQVLYCVRFGLLGYRVLAPEFHGDVFLSLLDLLHHALDEHARDPSSASAVIRDTLEALRSIVACMPPQRLALYPQILWVCVALLNHAKRESVLYHVAIVELLVEILRVPHFATNELLQDVLLCKKPQQWSDDQASVLRTMVWTLDRGCIRTQQLILDVITQFIVLPTPVLHANPVEHVVICSIVLIPSLLAGTMTTRQQRRSQTPENNDDGDSSMDEESDADPVVLWRVPPVQQAMDLQYAWLAMGSVALGEVFVAIRGALLLDQGESSHDADEAASGTRTRTLTQQFAEAFMAEAFALSSDHAAAIVTMCFEILVKILAVEDAKHKPHPTTISTTHRHQKTTREANRDVVAVTLWLVESLVSELKNHKVLPWRPTSALLGSLARLVRNPQETPTWHAAVRIMTCLGASNRSTSAATNFIALPLSPPARPKPQLTVSVARENNDVSQSSPHRLFDSPAKPSKRSSARDSSSSGGAATPSKKDGSTPSSARRFMNLMGGSGHRTSSSPGGSSRSTPSNQITNQISSNQTSSTPTSRTSSTHPFVTTHETPVKKSARVQDPSEERSASPLANRRDL